ncbi:hypothetical protein cypCar_00015795 [Cyprinus carpio]|nr:hypothetical protein cypCar_00015795 [Cyprinus carpio]
MADPPTGPPEDINKISFWMPGNYIRTVQRTSESYQACKDTIACMKDRAHVERQYACRLAEWSNKWKSITETRPLYGSLLRAWQCFFSSTERLSALHTSISQSLVSEDAERIRSWQKETFLRKMFCGFRESHDLGTAFSHAQRPWEKRLKKLEKARVAYHKSCQREQNAQEKENQAKNKADLSESKLSKIQQAREKATQERGKARDHYEKVLEDVTGFAPRYMEEMESVFDQSQEEERKRISFLKQAFLSIHRHLDITNNERNGTRRLKSRNLERNQKHTEERRRKQVDSSPMSWRRLMIGGVRVRVLYNYTGEEPDELSFKAGEEFLKVEEEDDQGWCWGVKEGGVEGFYPANYVLPVK